jgi:DNA-binding NtrC family response regulator
MKKKADKKQEYKVLVIDDEPDICSLFKELLGNEGYGVVTAQDGLEGLERYGESKPDVIILDLKMPRMGGMETLRNIRKVDKDVIVIIITAYGSAFTVREAADLNVYEYISKPFNIETVKRVVSEALASGRKGER